MLKPNLQEVRGFMKDYRVIPVCREIYADLVTPIVMLQKLSRLSKKYYLLESIEGGERWGRYSFLGFDPVMNVTCRNHSLYITGSVTKTIQTTTPMDEIRKILADYNPPASRICLRLPADLLAILPMKCSDTLNRRSGSRKANFRNLT